MPREAVLLLMDRDGTLMEDVGYPSDPETVRLIPGAADAVRELVSRRFVPAVVSNQSGIARGLISNKQALAVHERFVELFETESGVRLPCFYCPHGPDDGCDCRKPRSGLLNEAARSLGMIGRPVVMIGDRSSDIEAGRAMNATTIHFGVDRAPIGEPADFVAKSWTAIRDYLIGMEAIA